MSVDSALAGQAVAPPAVAPPAVAPPAAEPPAPAAAPVARRAEEERLGSLGYLGTPAAGGSSRAIGARAEPGHESVSESITVVGEAAGIDTSSSAKVTTIEPGLPAETRRRRERRSVTAPQAAPPVAAADDMYFRPIERNPFVDTEEDPLSTFALDVDTGSWTLARAYLERGELPPPGAIRIEEHVNAQRYDDPAPRRGDFTLVAEGAPSPFAPDAGDGDYRLLRFAVRARDVARAERRPAVLTFVVDVSGSMDRENRLGLVKRALDLLLDELDRDDRVALVVYGTRGRVLLRPTRDHEAIRDAIRSLRPEGSTNAEEGLRLGYDVAAEAFRPDASNRIVLCSDGVANVGATGPEAILERIGREARRGIELTAVGVGMGNYNDALMERLADAGDGRYHYVDGLDEARRIFVEELTGTLETVARDAKVQVELDPRTVERWRLLGYENRDVADRDFRNDRVDAGEIGAGHAATALYEVRLAAGARPADRVGTLKLRWRSAATGAVEEAALALTVGDLERSFAAASRNLRLAAVTAELAERLGGSYYARDAAWAPLLAEAERLDERELPALARRAAELEARLGGERRTPDEGERER